MHGIPTATYHGVSLDGITRSVQVNFNCNVLPSHAHVSMREYPNIKALQEWLHCKFCSVLSKSMYGRALDCIIYSLRKYKPSDAKYL